MNIDEFFIRLGRVIGYGTGIEVGKDDTLYWRLGHFITALVTTLVIVGAVALSVSMIFTKKGE